MNTPEPQDQVSVAIFAQFLYTMIMASESLPHEMEAEVLRTHGGPVPVPGEQGDYVVMTMDIFRDMAGVGDDADFAASVDALKVSLDQAKAGKTMPLSDVLPRLQEKHGI